jgi:hypothetical protein
MWAFHLLPLAIAAGFPDRVLDLLLALGSQIFAKAAPMENREPTPEVAFDPVLSLLNVSPAHHTCVHRVSPFCARLPKARACLFSFTPHHFWGATVSPKPGRLRVIRIRRLRNLQA